MPELRIANADFFLVRSPLSRVSSDCVFTLIFNRRDMDKVLLVHNRQMGSKSAGWGMPGGMSEKGESAEKTLNRELKEELPGVNVEKIVPTGFDALFEDARDLKTIVVVCTLEESELSHENSEEIDNAQWFSPAALPKSTYFAHCRKITVVSENEGFRALRTCLRAYLG